MTRGEIWWAVLPGPAGRRPVVLVSRESSYMVRAAVTVVEVSTHIRGIASEVPLGKREGLTKPCVANGDNLVTIPKTRLTGRVGNISGAKLAALDAALKFSLGLR